MTASLRSWSPLALPLLLLLLFSGLFLLPKQGGVADTSLAPSIPLQESLPGWYGIKQQESERERSILAADTQFRKAAYLDLSLGEKMKTLPCFLSVIISGKDMNASIHRPELCLPSQGHFNLIGSPAELTLNNGKTVTLTRLQSCINISDDPSVPKIIHSIHYYIFVGHKHLTHSHFERVFLDTKDRIIKGQDQRWSYIQVGVNYDQELGITEQVADAQVQKFLTQALPQLILWEQIND
ncbi:MAG: exosortase-associated EpsI family protein [Akkermansia sp.]